MMEVKNDLINRFNHVFKRKNNLRFSRKDLIKDKEELLQELENLKELNKTLEKELEGMKSTVARESQKCFREGIRVGRKMAAIEEIGVLEELEILKEIEEILESDNNNNTEQGFIELQGVEVEQL